MTNSIIPVNGGAMPKIDRAAHDPRLGHLPPDLLLPADQVFGHRAQVLRMGLAAGMG